MKIDSIHAASIPPITKFEVEGLSSIVVIAGPNGIGKTRLVNSLLNSLRNPGSNPQYTISATCTEESERWGKKILDSRVQGDVSMIRATLQRQQRRGSWKSGVIQFDSTRRFRQVQPFQWDWNFPDPILENINWDYLFTTFESRYEDTIKQIYRMLGH